MKKILFPNLKKRNFIICMSAPAGTGKTSIAEKLLEDSKLNISKFTTCTSRKKRDGEVDGSCYHFLTRKEFENDIKKGAFLEWEENHGNLYGIRKDDLERELKNDKNQLLVIDIKGSFSVMDIFPENTILLVVLPPSFEELEKRLKVRGKIEQKELETRLETARKELKICQDSFDKINYLVVNDDFGSAIDEIKSIIVAEQLKVVNY